MEATKDVAATDVTFSSESMAIMRVTAPTVELQGPDEIAAAMQKFDDEQFMSEIMGQAIGKWFYSFKIQEKAVEGVSAKGAHEFARLRAEQGFPIRVPPYGVNIGEVTQNNEVGMRAVVTMRDYRSGQEAVGSAFYPHYETRSDGTRKFDKHADRKALAVAERNAILRLIPEAVIITALKARAVIVAKNEARMLATAPSAPAERRLAAGNGYADEGAEPRRGDRVPLRGTPEAFVMPFGKTKGTALGQMDTEDLEGAVNWAAEKGKFSEFVEAGRAVLKNRAGGELFQDDRDLED